ncbi:MFS transporter [Kaistia adipata]|uniref:MFS transporter n=1 Tax=Kaistia adipata TaxID=166954 RepID=UPI000419FED7|nr:MFS transporter [Kaistia adipata]
MPSSDPKKTEARARYWRVAGVLLLIGIEALLFGYSYPFFSLALESKGIATWLIGLNASIAGAGILIFGPFVPWLIDRLGLRLLVAAQFALSLASFAAILLFDDIVVWFVARFVMGTCFSALWTTTEIWLNGVVDDRNRGRIVGASGTLYAACQFMGPLLLSGTGSTGSLPLVVAMVPLAIGVAVALSIRSAVGEVEDDEESGDVHTLRMSLTLAGSLIAAAFLTGIGETAMQSLLPLYGLAYGLTEAGASRLVAVFSLGEAVLIVALGWFADRHGRRLTLIGCTVLAVVSTLAFPLVMNQAFLLEPVIFLAGGTVSGLYTLGIVLIGQDFRGQRLAVVSTGFAMAYSAGSVIGSTLIGVLMDLFGSEALPISVAAGFVALLIFLARPVRKATNELPVD